MHPHATHASVSADAVTEIPPSLNVHRALLISSMETVVNACWDSGVTLGDRVVIFGFGLIGNLLASVIRLMPGVDPVIIDHDPQRLEAARRSGYSTTDNIGATAFDIAFNTTASSRALQQAIDITATDGRVIELSWYGNRTVELQLGSAFHHGRKRIISSQVSRIPQHVSARHDYASRKTLCITLLLDTNISLADSNCHTLPFNAAPAHFNALRQQAINLPAAILEY